MDSATSFWTALRESQVVRVLSFDYGQYGAEREIQAAKYLVTYAKDNMALGYPMHHTILKLTLPDIQSALLGGDVKAVAQQHTLTCIPKTYVPGRNLMMLSFAAAYAFNDLANSIYGGWVAIDSSYPDCRGEFLKAAGKAILSALGTDTLDNWRPWVSIVAPVLMQNKSQVVAMGEKLGVPWDLTRSCYSDGSFPCMVCDSCLKRMEAFHAQGLRDPLVNVDLWEQYVANLEKG
jgi:7-cyano-7-deazaguanine synthase